MEIRKQRDELADSEYQQELKVNKCSICCVKTHSKADDEEGPGSPSDMTEVLRQIYQLNFDYRDKNFIVCFQCSFTIGYMKSCYYQMRRSEFEFQNAIDQLASRAKSAIENIEAKCRKMPTGLSLLAECGTDLENKTRQCIIASSSWKNGSMMSPNCADMNEESYELHDNSSSYQPDPSGKNEMNPAGGITYWAVPESELKEQTDDFDKGLLISSPHSEDDDDCDSDALVIDEEKCDMETEDDCSLSEPNRSSSEILPQSSVVNLYSTIPLVNKVEMNVHKSLSMDSGRGDDILSAGYYGGYGNRLQRYPQLLQNQRGATTFVNEELNLDADETCRRAEFKPEKVDEEPLNLVVSNDLESNERPSDEKLNVSLNKSTPLEAKTKPRRVANGTVMETASKYYSQGFYACPDCQKKFTRRYPFWDHLKIHQGKGSVCPECNKVFPRGHNLELHMRTHTGEKPYKCTVCQRGFTDGSNLKVHMRHHTGERPYPCPVCKKGFSTTSRLRLHRLQHTGERPHQCEVCKAGFCTKNQLDVHHQRKHTYEKRPVFICNYCSKEYVSKYTLRNHIKKHHGSKLDGQV